MARRVVRKDNTKVLESSEKELWYAIRKAAQCVNKSFVASENQCRIKTLNHLGENLRCEVENVELTLTYSTIHAVVKDDDKNEVALAKVRLDVTPTGSYYWVLEETEVLGR